MDNLWGDALWRQFGAAIDVLENVITACPESLWTERLWPDSPDSPFPPRFAEFWHVSHHALVWLDLYLSGAPEGNFSPPPPFAQGELDSFEALPERPYAKEVLLAYLGSTRRRRHDTLTALTDEQARRHVSFPWMKGQPFTWLELQLYNLRHLQEHASQLSLFLGQHAVPDADLGWIARSKSDPGSDSVGWQATE